jgi:hypothetical protein
VWFSSDGSRALLVAQTAAAASDVDAQEATLAHVRSAFVTAQKETDGSASAGLVMTGPVVFSVATRNRIKSDAARFSALATLMVASILLLVYRSARLLAFGLLPVISGAIAGIAAVSLFFGSVHGITLGFGVTLIGEAVYARCLSAMKEDRVRASKILAGPKVQFEGEKKAFVEDIRQALFASKIVSYAQGFMLLREAAKEYKWNLNYGSISNVWREGCIIRSAFLGKIKEAFDRNPKLTNLLVDSYFAAEIERAQSGWRRAIGAGVANGIPLPAMSAALAYFDGYRNGRLPANLLQAQRDYFGAHTYERVDRPRGQFFHTNWTGRGGTTASTTYNA